MATTLGIQRENFTLNGRLTYSELPGVRPEAKGLLMNSRFIQGIFDDRAAPRRFDRYGRRWDPEANTDRLIAALPEWKKYGLLGFTVGLQGGMPVLTIENRTIDCHPYSEDGRVIDQAFLYRLDRLIRAADDLGMAVIVSLLYQGQVNRMKEGRTITNAVATASRFLREGGYANVLVEVANEHTVG